MENDEKLGWSNCKSSGCPDSLVLLVEMYEAMNHYLASLEVALYIPCRI